MLLPTEVVKLIIEDFTYISEHPTEGIKLGPIEFFPQWYLAPLLTVYRLWHTMTEKYLF